jgi:hypothetical protein
VKLVPVRDTKAPRIPGRLKGKGYWMADDFDETPEEVIKAFEGC